MKGKRLGKQVAVIVIGAGINHKRFADDWKQKGFIPVYRFGGFITVHQAR